MKSTLILFCCLLIWIPALSQKMDCVNRLDSNKVIRIAKKRNAYWAGNLQSPPQIKFNDTACQWIVISTKYTHTNKGDCKHTNGCTVLKKVTLFIGATDKKVILKKKEKKIYPNYE